MPEVFSLRTLASYEEPSWDTNGNYAFWKGISIRGHTSRLWWRGIWTPKTSFKHLLSRYLEDYDYRETSSSTFQPVSPQTWKRNLSSFWIIKPRLLFKLEKKSWKNIQIGTKSEFYIFPTENRTCWTLRTAGTPHLVIWPAERNKRTPQVYSMIYNINNKI